MDKYGVQTELPDGKTASDTPLCPVCGEPLVQTGQTWRCPNHGTAPLEPSYPTSDDDE